MPAQEITPNQSISQVEQNVLRRINDGQSAGAFEIEELLQDLGRLHDWGATDSRDQCFLMSQQFLCDAKNLPPLVRLLKQRAQWLGNSPAYAEECRDVLASAAASRLEESIIASAPFANERPLECLKHIESLIRLNPGVAVMSRAWGYGTVAKFDEFYKRVTVDFDVKPEHSMSFAFAASALKPIGETHILAVRHKDKAAFDELCAKSPDKVVALALESYGPMNVVQLEQELAGGKILPSGIEFKNFWTRARTRLKSDKRYTIPPVAKKNEPIVFSDTVSPVGDAGWFDALSRNKSVKELLEAMDKLAENGVPPSDPKHRAVLAERLAFVLKASTATREDNVKAEATMLALKFGFEELEVALKARQNEEFATVPGKADTVALRATLAKPTVALNAARKIRGERLKEMISLIPVKTDPDVAAAFIAAIPKMPYVLLETLAPQILSGCAGAEFIAFVRDAYTVADIPFHLILWICRFQSDEQISKIISASMVGTQAVLALEPEVTGVELTLQHLIADCFKDIKRGKDKERWWVAELASRMLPEERAAFFVRIRAVDESAWGPLKKREIERALVDEYPELARITAADSAAQEAATQRITSMRSYGEHQAAFRDLVENKIPKNARDIDTARSYGDL
ncbi:MAG: hypothetical protein FWG05_06430, partial [Kiritimatiellaeota bacterium]|nr:hypothetical protein [Kiritimatiellota bacterium]